ncbi:MAG: 2-oxoacid:acceptor oxidoreductase family protein, partial [Candidatus Aureabacteria bacterium]|nr:2-oxoacid:acceptor oxidoreductase family protein [Candidatus Auribacterota bacterium]
RGGCNSTEIRISRGRVETRVGRIDILIPLTKEAIPHLGGRINDATIVIGEKAIVGRDRMIDLPFTAIASEIGGAVYANTVAVGALCALLKIEQAECVKSVRGFFEKKGAAVQEKNAEAFRRGYERGAALIPQIAIAISADPSVAGEMMLTGADTIALGAVAGGCNFVCAYPMSPGTTVLTAMAEYSRRFDIIVEQVEDEIGVATMAIGAWYAGARALVTTSGGGFALMGEAVSLAGAIETPLVVHVAQRPGPATGLPTRTEQGDLNLAMHAGQGDFLRVVLAPGDLAEGYALTRAAFTIADRYQSPVFILTDQYFVDSYYTTPPFEVPDEPPSNNVVRTSAEYRRYKIKTVIGADDYASMREILTRRLRRASDEGNFPDLIVVDGGRGQLSAAEDVLRELGLEDQPVIGLSKPRTERKRGERDAVDKIILRGNPDPVILAENHPTLRMLQYIRDEAHRTAIGFHRKTRSKSHLKSALDDLPGVGATRRQALLIHFGSVKALRAAPIEAIAALPGFGPALAQRVWDSLRKDVAED